ncbi:hypothetical protein A4A49_30989 [Nicotiana attenuata]|uniref:Uncharacterized protein n=1 Tax=Nicotiana attenuata TaxID=49451 RepID=A0A314L5G6_NICAT|nr:hypothetical protein A4A49_30989 [Nicotiana attenuata]
MLIRNFDSPVLLSIAIELKRRAVGTDILAAESKASCNYTDPCRTKKLRAVSTVSSVISIIFLFFLQPWQEKIMENIIFLLLDK